MDYFCGAVPTKHMVSQDTQSSIMCVSQKNKFKSSFQSLKEMTLPDK